MCLISKLQHLILVATIAVEIISINQIKVLVDSLHYDNNFHKQIIRWFENAQTN